MNKRMGLYIWVFLLSSMTGLMLVSCGIISPTPVPPYYHYTPSKKSGIHVEFDYPSSWIFRKDTEDTNFMQLWFGDPRLNTVPTRTPNESHDTPSDFGRICIYIEPIEPGKTLDNLYETYTQKDSYASWITPLNDYKIKIDGYEAFVLEDQMEPNPSIDGNGYTSLMFERRIFFAVENQIYQINFIVAEKERGGEFEQGYEYFFNSLKIVP